MNKFILLIILLGSVSAEDYSSRDYHIFSGKSHGELARAIVKELGAELEPAHIKSLKDGSRSVFVEEKVNNKNVFLIQPVCGSDGASINDNLMELFMMIRELKRSSCRKLNLVIPYFGYTKDSLELNVEDVAAILESADVDRVVCLDLSSRDLQACFHKATVDHLSASPLFAAYFAKIALLDPVVIAFKETGKVFLEKLEACGVEADFAKAVQKKGKGIKIDPIDFAGGFEQRDVILADDVCDAAALVNAALLLKKMGARQIYACLTHPAFSPEELEALKNAPFEEVVVMDTLPLRGSLPGNFKQLSIAPLLAEAIFRIETNRSLKEI